MTAADPIAIFAEWFEAASRCGVDKPNAMTLATTGASGQPTARVVLLSSFDERGFVFHTNYQSAKARDLEHEPRAALVFWWDPLGRQVRIEGRVERTSPAESDAYFARRPRGSQIGAWASDQSRPLASRAVLESRVRELEREYAGRPVPRPPHWGGYRLVPAAIEFWQDRENRLHERTRYERDAQGVWRSVILAP
ncbi:MAG TPA: pyridoxamine 5'-phosphate oxidase [Burkholderiales bacterium]